MYRRESQYRSGPAWHVIEVHFSKDPLMMVKKGTLVAALTMPTRGVPIETDRASSAETQHGCLSVPFRAVKVRMP